MSDTTKILGRAQRSGMLVAGSDDLTFRWYLTECCRASAKGSMDATVCRACYNEIDPSYGGVYDEKWDGPIVPE
jgi:hypothetical protein